MVNVRDAVIADASAIAGLLTLLGHSRSVESIEAEIALGGSAAGSVVVAAKADTVVGLAAFAIWRAFAEQMWVCRLSAIAVQSESRGVGTGGLLVREVERRAQAASCAVVELSCGRRQERAAAHAFYTSLGYEDACHHHAIFRKPVTSDDGRRHG
jgi:GNAT superfamily N-acetyltransferase